MKSLWDMCFNRFIFVFSFCLPGVFWAQLDGFGPVMKFGYVINTSAEESAPKCRMDSTGMEIYFVRTFDVNNFGGEYDQDVWVSTRNDDGVWNMAKNMDNINNSNHNSIGTILDKEMYVLFSEKNNKRFSIRKSDLSTIEVEAQSKWNKPKPIDANIDIKNGPLDFCLSKDKKYMIISAQQPNTQGKEDLFLYNFQTKELTPLSNKINTSESEISPFLNETADTLFFSSNGRDGQGGFDIFYSVRGKDMLDWSLPINLGEQINSSGFDAYFSLCGKTFFWSSNREGTHSDIYYAEMITEKPLEVNVKVHEISFLNGNDGAIEIEPKGGQKPYNIQWNTGAFTNKISYLTEGDYTVLVTDGNGKKINKSITLKAPPPKLKEVLVFPEVQFESGTWKFIDKENIRSKDSIELIANILKNYPSIRLELWSHTDAIGEPEDNLKLSFNRARAVYTVLVKKHHIEAQRLIPVGKGETMPARFKDPKTGDMIELTELNIAKLANGDEEFEKRLQQKNRRTEGKIIDLNFLPDHTKEPEKEYFIDIE